MISKSMTNDKLPTEQKSYTIEEEWSEIDNSWVNNTLQKAPEFEETITSPRFPEEENAATELRIKEEMIAQLTQSLDSLKISQKEKDKEIRSMAQELYEAKLKIAEQTNLIAELSFELKSQRNSIISVSKELFSKAEKLENEREKLCKDNSSFLNDIKELDLKLRTIPGRPRLASPIKTKRKVRKFVSLTPKDNKIVFEIANELGVASIGNILPAVRALKNASLLNKKEKQFIEKVSGLITQLTPSGDQMSLSHIWLWIRSLVQEYLSLKKHESLIETESGIVRELKEALCVRNIYNIPHIIKGLLVENEYLLVIVSKLKHFFNMNDDASIEDLHKKINNISSRTYGQ